MYQSLLGDKIVVSGKGFENPMTLTLSPAMQIDLDYSLEIVSENKLELYIKRDRLWRTEFDCITAHAVQIGVVNYTLQEGARIVCVVPDPKINPSVVKVYQSQSKILQVSGTDLMNDDAVKIALHPTLYGAYQVLRVHENVITVKLNTDCAWLPAAFSLDDGQSQVLHITSIDTGAGKLVFDIPIVVAHIIKDRVGVVCDDTCEFAFDGVCDVGGDTFVKGSGKWANACMDSTDCTDCGGVEAVEDYSEVVDVAEDITLCANTCIHARNDVCDDARGTMHCEHGESCIHRRL